MHTCPFRPARVLVASVDTHRKSELQRQIQVGTRKLMILNCIYSTLLQEAQESLAVYEQQYKEFEQQDQALRRDDNTLRQEKVCMEHAAIS